MSSLLNIALVFVLMVLSCVDVFGGKDKPKPKPVSCPYRVVIDAGDLEGFQALVAGNGLDLEGGHCGCEQRCDRQLPLLQLAALRGREDMVRMLLDAGVRVFGSYFSPGTRALMDATWRGHIEIVKLLLDAWDGSRSAWDEAFFYAIELTHHEIVALFIQRGIDVNEGMHTRMHPLHIAARVGDPGIVRQLLDAGAQVDLLDMDLRVPLHCAAGAGHIEVVEVLLAAGANPAWKCWTQYDEEYTPLDVARYRLAQWQERTSDEITDYRKWNGPTEESLYTEEENEAFRQEKIRRLERIIEILEAAERGWADRQRAMREAAYEEAYAGVPELFEEARREVEAGIRPIRHPGVLTLEPAGCFDPIGLGW